MFGIGLPEMIVIFAVALIVVGPDKLPGLARSLAKGLMEMKKTLEQVKENLSQEGEVLDSVQTDLKKTAEELKKKMIDVDPASWESSPADAAQEGKTPESPPLQPAIAPSPGVIPPITEAPPAEPAHSKPDAAVQASATEAPGKTQQPDPPEQQHV
jgi:sec-independent protein translocase protein TatB